MKIIYQAFFLCLFVFIVPVQQEWKGGSRKKEDNRLWENAPKKGFINNNEEWSKLWKAWNKDKQVPKIDFKKQLILVAAAQGPNTITIERLIVGKKDLKFRWMATEKGGPGFIYRILKISRLGIDSVNGKKI